MTSTPKSSGLRADPILEEPDEDFDDEDDQDTLTSGCNYISGAASTRDISMMTSSRCSVSSGSEYSETSACSCTSEVPVCRKKSQTSFDIPSPDEESRTKSTPIVVYPLRMSSRGSHGDTTSVDENSSLTCVLSYLNCCETVEGKLTAMCEKYSAVFKDRQKLQLRVSQMSDELDDLRNERRDLQGRYDRAVVVRDRLKMVCQSLQIQLKMLRDERGPQEEVLTRTVAEESHQWAEKCGRLEEERSAWMMEKEDLVEELKEREGRLAMVIRKYDNVRDISRELAEKCRRFSAESAEWKSRCEVTRKEKEELVELKKRLEEENGCLLKRIEKMEIKTSLETKLARSRRKKLRLQNEMEKEAAARSLRDAEARLSEQRASLDAATEQAASWNAHWLQSRQTYQDLSEQMSKQQEELVVATSQMLMLENVCRTLQSERFELLEQVRECALENNVQQYVKQVVSDYVEGHAKPSLSVHQANVVDVSPEDAGEEPRQFTICHVNVFDIPPEEAMKFIAPRTPEDVVDLGTANMRFRFAETSSSKSVATSNNSMTMSATTSDLSTMPRRSEVASSMMESFNGFQSARTSVSGDSDKTLVQGVESSELHYEESVETVEEVRCEEVVNNHDESLEETVEERRLDNGKRVEERRFESISDMDAESLRRLTILMKSLSEYTDFGFPRQNNVEKAESSRIVDDKTECKETTSNTSTSPSKEVVVEAANIVAILRQEATLRFHTEFEGRPEQRERTKMTIDEHKSRSWTNCEPDSHGDAGVATVKAAPSETDVICMTAIRETQDVVDCLPLDVVDCLPLEVVKESVVEAVAVEETCTLTEAMNGGERFSGVRRRDLVEEPVTEVDQLRVLEERVDEEKVVDGDVVEDVKAPKKKKKGFKMFMKNLLF